MSDAGAAGGWKPSFNPWLIAIAVTLAAFMEILDTTIVNVALPYIAGSLAASSDEATYALTAYLVANGHRAHHRGLAVRHDRPQALFPDLPRHVHGLLVPVRHLAEPRATRGLPRLPGLLRAAACSPTSRPSSSTPSRRPSAAPPSRSRRSPPSWRRCSGPTLGGYLIDKLDWRWIFFVNIPFGAVAVFSNFVLVEDPPWEKEKSQKKTRGIDYIGLTLISLGLGCMQIMLDDTAARTTTGSARASSS